MMTLEAFLTVFVRTRPCTGSLTSVTDNDGSIVQGLHPGSNAQKEQTTLALRLGLRRLMVSG